jgi:hypothetical protein
MASFTGFLDSAAGAALSPKGNLGDYAHASRLFVTENLKLAPHTKFLYHCFFQMDPAAASVLPDLKSRHELEIGMLVKSAELPKFSADVETKNKYNRKKNVQTAIKYNPVTITFHDHNYGVTTALLEAYYRYNFSDGNYGKIPGAFNKAGSGDNTYKGPGRNQHSYGLDNGQTVPFFQNIQISQMARKAYTTYTLVNPIITDWQHDTVDSSDGATTMVNTITVMYEAVFYDRGNVETGSGGSPKGFGDPSHYDTTPSMLNGGGIGGILGTASNLFGFITQGTGFDNPLQAGLSAAGLIASVRNLSSEGLRQEGFNVLTGAIGAAGGIDVSGVAQTFFPKNGGSGGAADLAIATAAVVGLSSLSKAFSTKTDSNNKSAIESAARQLHQSNFQSGGNAGTVNAATSNFNNLGTADRAALNSLITGT